MADKDETSGLTGLVNLADVLRWLDVNILDRNGHLFLLLLLLLFLLRLSLLLLGLCSSPLLLLRLGLPILLL